MIKKLRKNKKGFLLAEQTVKIIISLLAIAGLIFLLVSLYYSSQTAEKKRQATQMLTESNNGLDDVLKKFISSDNSSMNFQFNGALGWYMYFFTGTKIRPNECLGDNCICICDNVGSFDWFGLSASELERQVEECDENGACLVIETLVDYPSVDGFEMTKGLNVLIEKQEGGILISKV